MTNEECAYQGLNRIVNERDDLRKQVNALLHDGNRAREWQSKANVLMVENAALKAKLGERAEPERDICTKWAMLVYSEQTPCGPAVPWLAKKLRELIAEQGLVEVNGSLVPKSCHCKR